MGTGWPHHACAGSDSILYLYAVRLRLSQVDITAVVSSLSSAKLPGSQRLQSEKLFYV